MNVCDQILKGGAFSLLQTANSSSLHTEFVDYLKTLDQAGAKKAIDAGFDLTIPTNAGLVPLKNNFSNQSFQTWKKEVMKLTTGNFDASQMATFFQKTGDRVIVDAWLTCVLPKSPELWRVDVNASAGIVNITLVLVIPGGGNAKVTGKAFVKNGKLKAGKIPKVIPSNTPLQLSYQITNLTEPFIFSLPNDRGSVFQVVYPGPVSPSPIAKVPTSKRQGKDGGGTYSVLAEVTLDFDQRIRVWGGAIGQGTLPNAVGAIFLLHRGNTEYSQNSIYMKQDPKGNQPATTMHDKPFTGTPIGSYELFYDCKAGDTMKFESIVSTEKGATIVNHLLFIDYLGY